MREIKFRGQTVDTKKMIEGFYYYCIDDQKHYIKTIVNDLSDGKENPPFTYQKDIEVIPETVGQFTGLKDKNGKYIFEGDIVVFANDYISLDDDEGNRISLKQAYELEYEGVQKSIVKKWGIITGDFADWNEWTIMFAIGSDYIFEVIGNKFENLELLEEPCKK